jgi:hypothetical protein
MPAVGDGDDQDHAELVANSADATSGTRSMPAFRSVVSGLVSFDASYFGQAGVGGLVRWG